MGTQLLLLETSTPSWKLDQRTREIGRRGVAEARAALRRAATVTDTRPTGRRRAA